MTRSVAWNQEVEGPECSSLCRLQAEDTDMNTDTNLDWQVLMEPYIIALLWTFGLPALVLVGLLIYQTAKEMAQV